MLLSDIFDNLTFGELSQLYVSGRDQIGIQPCDYEQIMPHINLGLTELYKRFDLKRNSVLVQLDPSISQYQLHSKYALSAETPVAIPYIIDSTEFPFEDDILHIESVYDKYENKLALNDPNNTIDVVNGVPTPILEQTVGGAFKTYTISTPSYLSIQSSYTDKSALLKVNYRAKHRKVGNFDLDLTTEEVELPYGLMEALLNYVDGRVYSNMSEQDGTLYTQKFEMACRKIEELGLENISRPTNEKLDNNGWA